MSFEHAILPLVKSPNIASFPAEKLALRLPALIAAWREAQPRHAARPLRGSRQPSRDSNLSSDELETAAESLLSLQRGLTGGRDLAGSGYMENKSMLDAYLLYYWPVSYMQVSLLLEELRPLLPHGPGRVLDLGCGPGPASAALSDFGARELMLVDSSGRALDLAKRLLSSDSGAPAARAPRISFNSRDIESASDLPAGPFDFIVIAHALNEIWKNSPDRFVRRGALLERVVGLLSPGGLLLVVEPALLATSRDALALRDKLAAAGHEIVAPCPGSYPCPALAAGPTRTCHLDTPWLAPEPVASLAAAAGLDRQSVKCTWFALRVKDALYRGMERGGMDLIDGPGGSGGPNSSATPSGNKARSGDIVRARVVSDALLNKAGRRRFFLCAEGKLTSLSAAREDARARAMHFFDLRRGDVVSLRFAELRAGGGLGIAPETILSVDRRAPQPDRISVESSRRPE
jgi:SAM-dependent methyltransferase